MRFVALFLIATLCSAQAPAPLAQVAATPLASAASITVPQGTPVPLTLVSSIHSKSTRTGDPVRAIVAFPVTVGAQMAIPAGTYVQGTVTAVKGPTTGTQTPTLRVHFTQLLFTNGYSVPLDATNTQALLLEPGLPTRATDALAFAGDGAPLLGDGFAAEGQTTPQLPPLPQTGPNPAVIGGAIAGGTAAVLILALVLSHRHAASVDYVLFESGWQFQMTLQQPLTLDASKVAAALAASPAH